MDGNFLQENFISYFAQMYIYLPAIENDENYLQEFMDICGLKLVSYTVDDKRRDAKDGDVLSGKWECKDSNSTIKYSFFVNNSEGNSDEANDLVFQYDGENENVSKNDDSDPLLSKLEKFIHDKYADDKELINKVNDYWMDNRVTFFKLLRFRNHDNNLKRLKAIQQQVIYFNDNPLRFISELIQNADDCEYDDEANSLFMEFNEKERTITLEYPEKGFSFSDIISLSGVGESNKTGNDEKSIIKIGEKGRGFKSVFAYCSKVSVHSRKYHFKYDIENRQSSIFEPMLLDDTEEESGTKLVLTLNSTVEITKDSSDDNEKEKDNVQIGMKNLWEDIKAEYGAIDIDDCSDDDRYKLYRNNPVFFTRSIRKLELIFEGENSEERITIDNKRNDDDLENASMYFSYEVDKQTKREYTLYLFGEKRELTYPPEVIKERYSGLEGFENVSSDFVDSLSKNLPIYVYGIKGIDEKGIVNQGKEIPKIVGHMYTYLPTSMNMNMPFIIHAPFKLVQNRSCPEMINGTTKFTAWNEFIFNNIFGNEEGNDESDSANASLMYSWYKKYLKVIDNIWEYLPADSNLFAKFKSKSSKFINSEEYQSVANNYIDKMNNGPAKAVKENFKKYKIFSIWKNPCEEDASVNEYASYSDIYFQDDLIAKFDIEHDNQFFNPYRAVIQHHLSSDKNEKIKKVFIKSFAPGSEDYNQLDNFCNFLEDKTEDIYITWEAVINYKEKLDKSNDDEREKAGYTSSNIDIKKKFSSLFLSQETWGDRYDNIKGILKDAANRVLCLPIRQFHNGAERILLSYIKSVNWIWFDNPDNEYIKSMRYTNKQGRYYIDMAIAVLNVSDLSVLNQNRDDNMVISDLMEQVKSYVDLYNKITVIDNDNAKILVKRINYYISRCIYENFSNGIKKNEKASLEKDSLNLNDLLGKNEYSNYLNSILYIWGPWDDSDNERDTNIFNENLKAKAFKELTCLVAEKWDYTKEFIFSLEFLSPELLSIDGFMDKENLKIVNKNSDYLEPEQFNNVEQENYAKLFEAYPKGYYVCDEDIFAQKDYIKFKNSQIFIIKKYETEDEKIKILESANIDEQQYPDEYLFEDLRLCLFSDSPEKEWKNIQKNYSDNNRNSCISAALSDSKKKSELVSLIQIARTHDVITKKIDGTDEKKNVPTKADKFLDELLQNCDDNIDPQEACIKISLTESDNRYQMILSYKEKTGGFSPKDIVGIVGVRRSTKDKNNVTDKIGKKGIGFKNIYTVFDRTKIFSNGFQICLDSTKAFLVPENEDYSNINKEFPIEVTADKKCLKNHQDTLGKYYKNHGTEPAHFPIVEWVEDMSDIDKLTQKDIENGYTVFVFDVKTGLEDTIKNQLNSISEKILFLYNTNEVKFCDKTTQGECQKPIKYIKGKVVCDANNPKNKIKFLDDIENVTSDDNESVTGYVYVGLPTSTKTGGRVHLNIGNLELNDTRNLLMDSDENKRYLNDFFNREKAFFVCEFNNFVKNIKDINSAYKYIPWDFYKQDDFAEGLKNLKFIPAIHSGKSREELCSLNSLMSNITYFITDEEMPWFEYIDKDYKLFDKDESVCFIMKNWLDEIDYYLPEGYLDCVEINHEMILNAIKENSKAADNIINPLAKWGKAWTSWEKKSYNFGSDAFDVTTYENDIVEIYLEELNPKYYYYIDETEFKAAAKENGYAEEKLSDLKKVYEKLFIEHEPINLISAKNYFDIVRKDINGIFKDTDKQFEVFKSIYTAMKKNVYNVDDKPIPDYHKRCIVISGNTYRLPECCLDLDSISLEICKKYSCLFKSENFEIKYCYEIKDEIKDLSDGLANANNSIFDEILFNKNNTIGEKQWNAFIEFLDEKEIYENDNYPQIIKNLFQYLTVKNNKNRINYWKKLLIYCQDRKFENLIDLDMNYDFLYNNEVAKAVYDYQNGEGKKIFYLRILINDEKSQNDLIKSHSEYYGFERIFRGDHFVKVISKMGFEDELSDSEVFEQLAERIHTASEKSESTGLNNRYIEVIINNVNGDDERHFILFQDSEDKTESLRGLFKREFQLYENVYSPLDKYNNLYPRMDNLSNTCSSKVLRDIKDTISEKTDKVKKTEQKDLLKTLLFYQYNHQDMLYRGYGMVCPITGIRSYIESAATDKTMPFLIKSNALHVFEYSIFGMNIRLPLWGSYFAEQLLYEYATDTVVTLKCNEKTLSILDNYYEENNSKGIWKKVVKNEEDKMEVINKLRSYLIPDLDSEDNISELKLLISIHMRQNRNEWGNVRKTKSNILDDYNSKEEQFEFNLTVAHRAILYAELEKGTLFTG